MYLSMIVSWVEKKTEQVSFALGESADGVFMYHRIRGDTEKRSVADAGKDVFPYHTFVKMSLIGAYLCRRHIFNTIMQYNTIN